MGFSALILSLMLAATATASPTCCSQILREQGPKAARDAAKVENLPGLSNTHIDQGFAGFFETAPETGNEMYWWYFPAQNGNTSAPLTIWLQGGPGGSSLFGLFSEMGPFSANADLTLSVNPTSWNNEYAMLFIDNPVGAGFSHTASPNGYCNDTKTCVAENLYSLLQDFYTVFPELLVNELYITGESYAGHYVPAIAYYIYEQNGAAPGERCREGDVAIPLAGVAIGDGWVDPINMIPAYPSMMFNLGLTSGTEYAAIRDYCDRTVAAIEAGDMQSAFEVWDQMLNGDIFPYANYFHNISGSNDYDNLMNTDEPAALGYYAAYVEQPAARAAMHTDDAAQQDGYQCEMHLTGDFMVSFAAELATLMDHYKVLIYSGQLDIIIGTALTSTYVPLLAWGGQDEFNAAPRAVWRASADAAEVSGFVTKARDFTFAVVRGAGHLVPYDQGARALDMITRFIEDRPFENQPDPSA